MKVWPDRPVINTLVTAAVFGALHTDHPVYAQLGCAGAGVALGFSYLWSGRNLLVPITGHALRNLVAILSRLNAFCVQHTGLLISLSTLCWQPPGLCGVCLAMQISHRAEHKVIWHGDVRRQLSGCYLAAGKTAGVHHGGSHVRTKWQTKWNWKTLCADLGIDQAAGYGMYSGLANSLWS
jgi:hypothetical protein